MANAENLKPIGNGERTKSEEREIQSKGGKASGAARRRKKSMKEAARLLMSQQPTPAEKRKLKAFGIDEEDADWQMVVMVAALGEAISGNIKAATFLRDTMGENPQTKLHEQEVKMRKEELKLKKELAEKDVQLEENGETLADLICASYEDEEDDGD